MGKMATPTTETDMNVYRLQHGITGKVVWVTASSKAAALMKHFGHTSIKGWIIEKKA